MDDYKDRLAELARLEAEKDRLVKQARLEAELGSELDRLRATLDNIPQAPAPGPSERLPSDDERREELQRLRPDVLRVAAGLAADIGRKVDLAGRLGVSPAGTGMWVAHQTAKLAMAIVTSCDLICDVGGDEAIDKALAALEGRGAPS